MARADMSGLPLRIDAHQHFWALARGDYGWLTPDLKPLYRDYLPQHLAPLLAASGIDRTVLVQAAPTDAETDFLLALADANPMVGAVVGWVDFERPDAPARIAELAAHPRFRGVRPMLQDLPDPRWLLEPRLEPALATLVACDLSLDALVRPVHLPVLLELLQRHPDLRVVIDHGAKPDIAAQAWHDWAPWLARIAADTRACCKLSGLVTEARSDWTPADIAPYARHILRCFGPERTLWGSDWPVLNLAADYSGWSALADDWLADDWRVDDWRLDDARDDARDDANARAGLGLDAAARALVRGGAAARVYSIETSITGSGDGQGDGRGDVREGKS
jgi:L-fuconolactonase